MSEAIPFLLPLTSDVEAYIRARTVQTLGVSGDPRMIPVLLPLLDDEDQNVRFQTAFALGKLGNTSGADLIRAYLIGGDTFARSNLIEPLTALKTLGLPAVPLVVDLAYDVMGMSFIEVECLDLLASILAEQNETSAQLVLKRMLEHRVKAVRLAAQQAIDQITSNRIGRNDER